MNNILSIASFLITSCAVNTTLESKDVIAAPHVEDKSTFSMRNYKNKCGFSSSIYKKFAKEGLTSDIINSFESSKKVKCSKLRSKDVIIVDYTKSIYEERFYVVSYSEKKIKYSALVSHAFNTDDDNGYARVFSNVPGSNFSSKGLYKIHIRVVRTVRPYSFPVEGLDSENNNAYRRNITIHRSLFNDNDYVGHSYGCFALTPEGIKKIKEYDIESSYLYVYYKEN